MYQNIFLIYCKMCWCIPTAYAQGRMHS